LGQGVQPGVFSQSCPAIIRINGVGVINLASVEVRAMWQPGRSEFVRESHNERLEGDEPARLPVGYLCRRWSKGKILIERNSTSKKRPPM
jgi:hypothetical protein